MKGVGDGEKLLCMICIRCSPHLTPTPCSRDPPGRRAHLDTTTAGPRTVPVRSGLSGVKTLELSRIPRPSDVLRAGTARALWLCQDAPPLDPLDQSWHFALTW